MNSSTNFGWQILLENHRASDVKNWLALNVHKINLR